MSLHWILVLTVTLLHCLTAHTIPVNVVHDVMKRSINDDMRRSIEELQKADCEADDAKFYSPSGTNGCIIYALNCHKLELESVKSECFKPGSDASNYVSRTTVYIDYIVLQKSQEQVTQKNCSCYENENTTYKEFISNIGTLVQMLNSIES